MGSAALLLNRFITAVHRTCCRTVHRPRPGHRTGGRPWGHPPRRRAFLLPVLPWERHPLQQAHTIQPRQDHVHDHDIGLGLLDQLPRRLAVAGVAHDLKLTGILQRVS